MDNFLDNFKIDFFFNFEKSHLLLTISNKSSRILLIYLQDLFSYMM